MHSLRKINEICTEFCRVEVFFRAFPVFVALTAGCMAYPNECTHSINNFSFFSFYIHLFFCGDAVTKRLAIEQSVNFPL